MGNSFSKGLFSALYMLVQCSTTDTSPSTSPSPNPSQTWPRTQAGPRLSLPWQVLHLSTSVTSSVREKQALLPPRFVGRMKSVGNNVLKAVPGTKTMPATVKGQSLLMVMVIDLFGQNGSTKSSVFLGFIFLTRGPGQIIPGFCLPSFELPCRLGNTTGFKGFHQAIRCLPHSKFHSS